MHPTPPVMTQPLPHCWGPGGIPDPKNEEFCGDFGEEGEMESGWAMTSCCLFFPAQVC